ncbi:ATP-binding cassette domain-containing protein [Microbulbifer sp. 2205BS26-8]|uniref:ATP-binding cassette domain-containing protein n=1 Tax=Microbulbifer sp. 2205BS26-8 TaxID=3064386 RepID=UPI00273D80D3|nr:ATP-binding cassette domain-containing protein [Microbulbifer sp. 2205BS26-8]MDP5208610.1 ATP-binding cassette domain-containing protein [Microbulbifer sp. 2205BS26-8]
MNRNTRWLVPEVIQTSNMDCGPASLKCLLEGFGVRVHYGHLRDACQTDVDGTSINTLERVAVELGLDAVQMVVPKDHLLLNAPGYLPGMVVVRLPNGNTHFVVAWRNHRGIVQLMDPASGRRWPSARRFLDELHVHTFSLSPKDWRNWAGGADFIDPLCERMQRLKVAGPDRATLCRRSLESAEWLTLAFLDAAVRMLTALVSAGALRPGGETNGMLQKLVEEFNADTTGAYTLVPEQYWCVRPCRPAGSAAGESLQMCPEQVEFSGAVILRVRGVRKTDAAKPHTGSLARALQAAPVRPLPQLWSLLREDGLFAPAIIALAMLGAVFGLMTEALLFRGLIDIHSELATGMQRMGGVVLLLGFLLTVMVLQFPVAKLQRVLGRHLETRFRMRFLSALPQIPEHFFQSRPTSDTAERSHRIAALRELPVLGGGILFNAFMLLATAAGIIWLVPSAAPLVLLMAAIQVAIPLLFQPVLNDHNMRVQTHTGALARFYMDALLGIVPIRTHGAGESVRREHEALLSEWIRASYTLLRFQLNSQALQLVVNCALAATLVIYCIHSRGADPDLLLLIYWVLALPPLGEDIAVRIREYPRQRTTLLRALEPLQAAEDQGGSDTTDKVAAFNPKRPAHFHFEDVRVNASGRAILDGINLEIGPGEHVAVVGASGAGKSSLAGLLLGWHKPARGRVLLNGAELQGELLARFRLHCAWVDPAIQLWNNSLLDNLHYGNAADAPLYPILEQADLLKLLASLPDGLQSALGESGALVSGGEGQRVRLGRALGREAPCCAILDEPFRGLDRDQRQRLLGRVRHTWRDVTLLCITHDITETQRFDRVLVVEDGRIVEDGAPAALCKRKGTRYAQLLLAEQNLWQDCWKSNDWRHLRMQGGRVSELSPQAEADPPRTANAPVESVCER